MQAEMIQAAATRHEALAGLQVQQVNSSTVLIAGIRTNFFAALQILDSAPTDTLDFDSLARELNAA